VVKILAEATDFSLLRIIQTDSEAHPDLYSVGARVRSWRYRRQGMMLTVHFHDCVNHRILLSKLDHYGIRGTFKALIDSYLKEIYQRVTIKKKYPLFKLGISQIWCTTGLDSWPSAISTVHK
jgi:hypothetical protein